MTISDQVLMAQTGYSAVLVANTCACLVAVVVLVASWRADESLRRRRSSD